jgi:hypothetical protein
MIECNRCKTLLNVSLRDNCKMCGEVYLCDECNMLHLYEIQHEWIIKYD